jgi:large subunit ribosomal protein L24
MKLKKGDNVMIMSGKDRKQSGKILRTYPQQERIVIDGLNMRKRHIRPRKQGQKGEIIQLPSPMNVSNVMLVCPKCGKPTRIGYKLTDTAKLRICKKCGGEM